MRLRACTALLALGLGGCPTPGQSAGLAEVDVAGFAARMRALCRSGIGAPAGEGTCPGPADAAAVHDGGAADADRAVPDAGAADDD
jgi:hypothetical protein